jgi:hypothetical protein
MRMENSNPRKLLKSIISVICEFSVLLWSKPFGLSLSFGLGPSRTRIHHPEGGWVGGRLVKSDFTGQDGSMHNVLFKLVLDSQCLYFAVDKLCTREIRVQLRQNYLVTCCHILGQHKTTLGWYYN